MTCTQALEEIGNCGLLLEEAGTESRRASEGGPRGRGQPGSWKGSTFPARSKWEGFPLPLPIQSSTPLNP